MKILLGPEYVSDEEEPDSEEASEGEQEDARDTFVDRTTVRLFTIISFMQISGGRRGGVVPLRFGSLTIDSAPHPLRDGASSLVDGSYFPHSCVVESSLSLSLSLDCPLLLSYFFHLFDLVVVKQQVKKLANLVLGRDTKTRGTRRRRMRRKEA